MPPLAVLLAFLVMLLAVSAAAQALRARAAALFERLHAEPGLTGEKGVEVAARWLREALPPRCRPALVEGSGTLCDHYDADEHLVTLSPAVYHGASLGAHVVAAHEAAHALQGTAGSRGLRARRLLQRTATVLAQTSLCLAFGGAFLTLLPGGRGYAWILALPFAALALSLAAGAACLPTEWDATRRALAWLSRTGRLPREGAALDLVRRFCRAAARTYLCHWADLLPSRRPGWRIPS